MSSPLSPEQLAEMFADIGAELTVEANGEGVLGAVAALATRRVDGAEYAGITIGREGGRYQTVGATDDLVGVCDEIQYELVSGPCVDAVLEQTTFNAADLVSDGRWPEFGRRCVQRTGIFSMLSMRLYVEADRHLIAGLNMYAHASGAFDENSEAIAHLLATHGALAVGKANAEAKANNLERALETSREIGIAIGVLMTAHKITRNQAFDLLRIASQHSHRKLRDIALDVADTGDLPAAGGKGRTAPTELR